MIWCVLKGRDAEDIVEIPLKFKKYVSMDKEYWFIDYTYKPKIKKIMIVGIIAAYDLCAKKYELQYEILRKRFLGWKADVSYSCDYLLNNIFETKEEVVKKLKRLKRRTNV